MQINASGYDLTTERSNLRGSRKVLMKVWGATRLYLSYCSITMEILDVYQDHRTQYYLDQKVLDQILHQATPAFLRVPRV